jgi:hypothetical protein
MTVGVGLCSITVLLSALRAISAQQAIVIGTVAALTTMSAMSGRIVTHAWIAWQRGFRHGCQAALACENSDGPDELPSRSVVSNRVSRIVRSGNGPWLSANGRQGDGQRSD